MTPEVTVIVVNWNTSAWLDRCLRSLSCQDGVAAEVIVVDNGSCDDSESLVRERYPQVQWRALGENRGFAAANNEGARLASGRYLAFLNPDAEAEPGWLSALRTALGSDGSVSLATSRIVHLDQPEMVDSAGDGWLRVGTGFKRGHRGHAVAWDQSDEVFSACGAAFMIRREVFDRLNGFDEDFFLVFEDVDLSYRARLAGHRCVYVPSAIVRHAVSTSLGRQSDLSVYYGQRNVEWVYLKNTPGPLLVRTLPAHVCYMAAAGLYFLARGRLGSYLQAKGAAVRGLPHVLVKRRAIQRSRTVSSRELWNAMTPGWVRHKWKEKGPALGGTP